MAENSFSFLSVLEVDSSERERWGKAVLSAFCDCVGGF